MLHKKKRKDLDGNKRKVTFAKYYQMLQSAEMFFKIKKTNSSPQMVVYGMKRILTMKAVIETILEYYIQMTD